MARKWFLVGLFLLAGSVGVCGFQVLNYLIEGNWPDVPIRLVWDALFGSPAAATAAPWHWFGRVPVAAAGTAAAYLAFLVSDLLRQR